MSGKTGEALDMASVLFLEDPYDPKSGSARRLLELAQICAREMVALKDGERLLPERVRVSFDVHRSVFTRLKIMGIEWNAGRPGMAPMLREVCKTITDKHFDETGTVEGGHVAQWSARNFH